MNSNYFDFGVFIDSNFDSGDTKILPEYNKKQSKKRRKLDNILFNVHARDDKRTIYAISWSEGTLMATDYLCARLYLTWIPPMLTYRIITPMIWWWTVSKVAKSVRKFFIKRGSL